MKKIIAALLAFGLVVLLVVMVLAVTPASVSAQVATATASRDIATPALIPGGTTEVTVTFTSLLTETKSFALKEDIPSGWTFTRGTDDADNFKESTHEWVWFEVGAGATKVVTYTLTVPVDALVVDYPISGTVMAAEVSNTVGGDGTVTVLLDILAYYRAFSGDASVVDTVDLLKAANDWSVDITPPGFTEPITTEQLLALADEWLSPFETLRLQTWLGPNYPLMQPLENFAQAVEDGTKGSVRIELYPGDGLVPFGELAAAIEQGTVDMGLLNTFHLRDDYPVMDAGELPFLYNDNDGLMAAVQAGIGELLSQKLTAHNITVLDWTTWGFYHLFSKDMMLDHPDDVVGKNIRAYGMQAEAISEWGGIPVWVPLGEIYTALDTGVLDGVTNFLDTYYRYALWEVAPYFCVNYDFGDLEALCINSDVWNSLDAKERDIITKATGDYVNEMMATVKQLDAEALETIKGYAGVTVYTLTPEQRAIWRDASQPVWDGWVQQVGPIGQQIIDIALSYNPLP